MNGHIPSPTKPNRSAGNVVVLITPFRVTGDVTIVTKDRILREGACTFGEDMFVGTNVAGHVHTGAKRYALQESLANNTDLPRSVLDIVFHVIEYEHIATKPSSPDD